MIKVMIADDHAIVRAGLRTLIESDPGLALVGEAADGRETLALCESLKPDILVLDVSMPELDGITVAKKLKAADDKVRILFITIHTDEAILREALKSGASGYVLKRVAEKELISAIRIVMRGDMYIEPSMIHLLVDTAKKTGPVIREALEPLTPRETEILKLIVQGYTNRQVGETLHISVRTVEGHRANISEKLGMKSRVELVRYARSRGLIA
ncbi:MAG: response regulator transcription factor [Spirochaetales bacterium]|nr:MAG: response regulator transcription factor [Spirochaetales bacterium]